MDGLKIVIFRIFPFAILICFVTFGISNLFNIMQLSYLTTETYNGTTIYTLDWQSYLSNLDPNTLKQAFTNVIDTQTYMNCVHSFQQLWDDGYDIGDIAKTIVNALIIVIDTVALILNLALIPIRLICGLLLMGMSLIGININYNGAIITVLKTLRNVLAIPMIAPWI